MRHGRKFNHLSRTSAHRKAMLSNMASSLILHKRINTTTAKAKALRVYIEPIITKSKTDTTHSRRMAFSYLQNKEAVNELFRNVSVKVMDRPGGYTRIIKTYNRKGDNAEMCMIELVDFNPLMLDSKTERKTTRRSRKKTSSETAGATAQQVNEIVKVDDVKEAIEEVKAEAEEVKEAVIEETKEATQAVEEKAPEIKAEVDGKVEAEENADDKSAEEA
jgi:large subunit ribosomal protein L17